MFSSQILLLEQNKTPTLHQAAATSIGIDKNIL